MCKFQMIYNYNFLKYVFHVNINCEISIVKVVKITSLPKGARGISLSDNYKIYFTSYSRWVSGVNLSDNQEMYLTSYLEWASGVNLFNDQVFN